MNILQEISNNPPESSSVVTPEWKGMHRNITTYIKRILKGHATDIKMSRGHFDSYGYFTANNGQIWYISIGDVRCGLTQVLIRTAESYKDYTGGSNRFISVDDNFADNLLNTIS